MRLTHLTEFRPSLHGFAFSNLWDDGTWKVTLPGGRVFRVVLRGRCGGMAFAALDLFHTPGTPAAQLTDSKLPPKGSPLERYIGQRQLGSLIGGGSSNLVRFAAWTFMPAGGKGGVGRRTRREAGRVLAAMAAGLPVPLGLIAADRLSGLGTNHQVVAWGIDNDDAQVRIRIYDPNHPLRDDVVLQFDWAGEGAVIETVGGLERARWRGVFVERYRHR
ncbi:MAG: hypothetical protein U1E26_01210 [Coriobacteriia bacterium]|nr:hypothetical protein [Coriobacteriia bacterium]